MLNPDPQLAAFVAAMNDDPVHYWPDVTCALILKALRAAIKAGVIAAPQKEVDDCRHPQCRDDWGNCAGPCGMKEAAP